MIYMDWANLDIFHLPLPSVSSSSGRAVVASSVDCITANALSRCNIQLPRWVLGCFFCSHSPNCKIWSPVSVQGDGKCTLDCPLDSEKICAIFLKEGLYRIVYFFQLSPLPSISPFLLSLSLSLSFISGMYDFCRLCSGIEKIFSTSWNFGEKRHWGNCSVQHR